MIGYSLQGKKPINGKIPVANKKGDRRYERKYRNERNE